MSEKMLLVTSCRCWSSSVQDISKMRGAQPPKVPEEKVHWFDIWSNPSWLLTCGAALTIASCSMFALISPLVELVPQSGLIGKLSVPVRSGDAVPVSTSYARTTARTGRVRAKRLTQRARREQ
eukprot:753370-Hanusia_phi.AAC.15